MNTNSTIPGTDSTGPFVVVIPAYKPDKKLLTLLAQLHIRSFTKVIVVDDGSGADYQVLFEEAALQGAEVLHHEKNRGKGAALKTGIRAAIDLYGPTKTWRKGTGTASAGTDNTPLPRIITADADGQHLPDDIMKVAETMIRMPGVLILGARDYLLPDEQPVSQGPQSASGDGHSAAAQTPDGVPRKSRWGNRITARVFKWTTGVECPDTQTGLRGIPACLLDLALSTPGDRYEYEMHFLQAAAEAGSIVSVPIRTVYEDNNSGSHFRPVRDSLRIYGRPIRYTLSSLAGAVTDFALFYALILALNGYLVPTLAIIAATVLARLCSGSLNFLLNKHWSFQSRGEIAGEALRYFILFAWIMCTSAILVALMARLSVPAQIAKIFVDSGLFIASYVIQKRWVFAAHPAGNTDTDDEDADMIIRSKDAGRTVRRRKAVSAHV